VISLSLTDKRTYIGVLDKHGYRVSVDGKPLPLHVLYCADRDWNTANGIRQLALASRQAADDADGIESQIVRAGGRKHSVPVGSANSGRAQHGSPVAQGRGARRAADGTPTATDAARGRADLDGRGPPRVSWDSRQPCVSPREARYARYTAAGSAWHGDGSVP
jgi:hypothetical protein